LLEAKANQSVLGQGRFMVFEMEHLMGMGERAVVSVLLFLFHQIEKRLDGSPTAIVLDEAWVFLKHELFKEFIRDWAKTLRKANAALMLSTQNWSDIFNSSLKDVLIETCPNKLFLPNPEATSETVRVYYEMLGVNSREIEMISRAMPKREYYQRTPNGRRLFNIGFGPVQYSQLNNDASLVQTLQQQSQNSTTLLQTLQVGNSLAAQELAEMEKLRQLMLTDITSKATYQAQQASSAQADGDMNDTFFTVPTGSNTDSRTYSPVPQQ